MSPPPQPAQTPLLVTFGPVTPAQTPLLIQTPNGFQSVIYRGAGDGSDDAPGLVTAVGQAAASGTPLCTPGSFTLLSTPEISGQSFTWYQCGATFTVNVPVGDGVTDAGLLWRASTGGILILSADPVVGKSVISVTTSPVWLVPGIQLEIGQPNCAQFLDVISITGTGPYTIKFKQAIEFPFTRSDGAQVIQVTSAVQGVNIFCQGSKWLIQNAGRAWELAASGDVAIYGPLDILSVAPGGFRNVGISLDDGSTNSKLVGPIRIDGAELTGTGTRIGLFAENWKNGETQGPIELIGCDIGVYAYSLRDSVIRGIRAINNLNYGGLFDLAGQAAFLPTIGGVVEDCQFIATGRDTGGGIGSYFADGCNYTVNKCMFAYNQGHGLVADILTPGQAEPFDLTFNECQFIQNGSIAGGTFGAYVNQAIRTTFSGSRFYDCENAGLEISANATESEISLSRFEACGSGLISSADVDLNQVRFTDCTDAVWASPGSAANITAVQCTVSWPGAQPTNMHGFRNSGSGVMTLIGCKVVPRVPTSFLAGILAEGGTTVVIGSRMGAASGFYGVYVNGVGPVVKVDATTDLGGATVATAGTLNTATATETLSTYTQT